MTGLLEGAAAPLMSLSSGGNEIDVQLAGLAAASEAATGRLDEDLVAESAGLVERAAGRLRLSSEHTLVAIAGATGSGKSSTFNALTGLDLSAVGVRRPTTSWATACVWGADGARELLGWLGIPERHQTTRDSMLDSRTEGTELDGVVLLDLPDHDSTEVAHHLEVDRLIEVADLMVWVLDPQKYADAAVHERYLAPLSGHDEVIIVVLNHIDTVPEQRREAMVADVRRLLARDGLAEVPVFAVAAKQGWGIPELKAEIVDRVARKHATVARLASDVRRTAEQLAAAGGDVPAPQLSEQRVEAFDDALAEAAGVPTVTGSMRQRLADRLARATGWPPVAWLSRPGAVASSDGVSVEGHRVDVEVRRLAGDVAGELPAPWQESVHRAATGRAEGLAGRLDEAAGGVELASDRLPAWAGLVRAVQWLLLAAAVCGGVWSVVALIGGGLGDAPQAAGVAVPLLLLVAGVVLGIALAAGCRLAGNRSAAARADAASSELRAALSEVADRDVVEPVRTELTAYASFRSGVQQALSGETQPESGAH